MYRVFRRQNGARRFLIPVALSAVQIHLNVRQIRNVKILPHIELTLTRFYSVRFNELNIKNKISLFSLNSCYGICFFAEASDSF